MKSNHAAVERAVSNQVLRDIVEQGFFETPGSLADARAACAELLFARSLIDAQTVRIEALVAPLHMPIS